MLRISVSSPLQTILSGCGLYSFVFAFSGIHECCAFPLQSGPREFALKHTGPNLLNTLPEAHLFFIFTSVKNTPSTLICTGRSAFDFQKVISTLALHETNPS